MQLPVVGTRVITYAYDGLLRLKEAVEHPGTGFTYAYDLAGNRIAASQNGTLVEQHTYDAANQVVGLTYDAAGNLTNDASTTYSYDALNRLTQQGSTSNSYNGDGVLVRQVAGATTTDYTQDLAAPLSQMLQSRQGGITTNHLYGLDRLATVTGATRSWYGTDALGSVRLTLSDSGAVLGGANYDPWGTVEGSAVAPFGFTGELQDSGGMVYLRARWYNPAQGRFGVRDPFQGDPERPDSLHPYQYGASDPVLMTDPSGQCAKGTFGNDNDPCTSAFRQAMNHLGWMPIRHEALFLDFNTADFARLTKWVTAGIRLEETGLSGPNTVRSILEAMELMERAFSFGRVRKILALDRTLPFALNQSAPGKHGPWEERIRPPGGGTSAVYLGGPDIVIITPGNNAYNAPINPALLIHEFGHRFDQVAGHFAQVAGRPRYWSSPRFSDPPVTPWMQAAGWYSVACTPDGSGEYALTAAGRAGAVSEYAAGGVYGVYAAYARTYYGDHTDSLHAQGFTSAANFVDAATRDANGNSFSGGSIAEDFAETFAWYVLRGGFKGAGGIANKDNTTGEPSPARKAALEAILKQFP